MKKYLQFSCRMLALIFSVMLFCSFLPLKFVNEQNTRDYIEFNGTLKNFSNVVQCDEQIEYKRNEQIDKINIDEMYQSLSENESSADLLSKNSNIHINKISRNGLTYLTTKGYMPKNSVYNDITKANYVVDPYDTRTKVEFPSMIPYSATGKIVAIYNNVYSNTLNETGSVKVIGTGFLVGPDIVMTAGHCIYADITTDDYDDGVANPRYADLIEFYPGLNGEEEENESFVYYSFAEAKTVLPAYENDPDLQQFDLGIIRLNREIGFQTGWYGLVSNYKSNSEIYTYGYPAEKNSTMWESHGSLLGLLDENRYATNVYATQGQSGSAYILLDSSEPLVCGVLSFGLENQTEEFKSGGVIINPLVLYLIEYLNNDQIYEKVATIKPSDYGFADAYPTDEATKINYATHTLESGFAFETRRYRTGYIQSEYIVMSPFRSGIEEAFIEYRFAIPIAKIEVDLSHWRELSTEWTYSSNCDAVLRIKQDDYYETVFDLLSSETNLPTDRSKPTTYVIEFPTPVYAFEFRMTSKSINTNDSNRGRICIGNMTLYTAGGQI